MGYIPTAYEEKRPSGKLLIDRSAINKALRLPRNLSYEVIPESAIAGKVMMRDVRAMMNNAARNGAVWNDGDVIGTAELADVLAANGVSRRTMFRVLRNAPHFAVSKRVRLVNLDDLAGKFLERKYRRRRRGVANV